MDPRPSVYTSETDGSDRVYLDTLGPVSGLAYRHTDPGGPDSATWNLNTDATFSHRALRQGRRVGITLAGARPWSGKLIAPQRGTPWACEADGDGALMDNYRAIPTGTNYYAAAEVIDNAITRGLPITQVTAEAPWTSLTSTPGDLPEVTVAEVADKCADQLNASWVIKDGRIRVVTPSYTSPTHLLYATDPGGSRTLDGLVTALYVRYTSNSTHALAHLWVRNATLEARYGVCVEDVLDLTDQQELSVTGATARANSVLGTAAIRTLFGGSFTVAHGQLTTLGGQPVCLASVQLPIVPMLVLTDPDRAGEIPGIGPSSFRVGEYAYSVDTGTAEVTVSNAVRTDLVSVLSRALVRKG